MSTAAPLERPSHVLRGMVLRSLAIVCFAIMSAAMKLASEDSVNEIEMVFYRSLFGLPIVALWIMTGPGPGVIRTNRPRAHLIRSMIGICGILMNFGGLIRLPLADAVTIGFTAPIFATILSALVLAERIGSQRWAAVAIGFVGVLFIMRPGGESLDHLGLLLAIGGAIGTAAVTVTVRQLGATEHPGAIVFWFFIASGVVTGIGMIFVGQAHLPRTWGLLALAGVAGAIAQITMTQSLRDAPVSMLMPFDYAQIVWATLIGWFLWSSIPGWATLWGAALIVASGLFTAWREQRLRREAILATPPLE